jgi:molybdopterin-guanine dinucleotide biosynthesis protein A
VSAAGILLTGGASRRMGRDKAAIVLDGLSLARRAAMTLAEACTPCVEVGPGRSDLFSLLEVPPGGGPLAAMVAGGHALRIEHGYVGPVVLLACDMPRVTSGLLGLLAGATGEESVVPEAGGRLQPLCARYTSGALEEAGVLVDQGVRSMHELLDRIPYRRLAEVDWGEVAPPDAFVDLDTPADL